MDDLISRQAFNKLLDEAIQYAEKINDSKSYFAYCTVQAIVNKLPSAEKRGKWESNEYLYTTRQTRCSECKTEFYVDDLLNVGEGAQEYLPNFCPHCGAKMGEVEE